MLLNLLQLIINLDCELGFTGGYFKKNFNCDVRVLSTLLPNSNSEMELALNEIFGADKWILG